jgi:hypothetical protein
VNYLDFDNPINELLEKYKGKLKRFSSFIRERITYKAGDFIYVINRQENSYPYIARLKELVLIEIAPSKFIPVLNVQW